MSSATAISHLLQVQASLAEAQSESDTAFSRSAGLPASMGKATADLKCKLPDCVKDDFVRLAHTLGQSESELLRQLVMVRLYGVDEVARMYGQVLRLGAGMGQESAPIGGSGR